MHLEKKEKEQKLDIQYTCTCMRRRERQKRGRDTKRQRYTKKVSIKEHKNEAIDIHVLGNGIIVLSIATYSFNKYYSTM